MLSGASYTLSRAASGIAPWLYGGARPSARLLCASSLLYLDVLEGLISGRANGLSPLHACNALRVPLYHERSLGLVPGCVNGLGPLRGLLVGRELPLFRAGSRLGFSTCDRLWLSARAKSGVSSTLPQLETGRSPWSCARARPLQ